MRLSWSIKNRTFNNQDLHVDHRGLICSSETRTNHLLNYCQKTGYFSNNTHVPNLLLDTKNKIAYCPLAKVASTSWKALMVYATGKVPTTNIWPSVHNRAFIKNIGLKYLSESLEMTEEVLQNYFKVIVVRHPFDRLISAWRDKFVMRNSPFRKNLGKRILRTYRNITNFEPSSEWNNTARFDEFAQYVAEKSLSNPHWRQYITCNPCYIKYNYIIKTETLEYDFKKIASLITIYNGTLPFIHSHQSKKSDVYFLSKSLPEFSRVSSLAMQYLYDKYGDDMNLFGYTWGQDTTTTKCSIPLENGGHCC